MENTENNPIFLSVIIPAYNEEKRIEPTLESVERYLAHQPYRSEIIIVNDGSHDNTPQVILDYIRFGSHELSRFVFVDNILNRGKGYAVKCGMKIARGSWRLFMDADNSTDVGHLDYFLPYALDGYDVVIGSIDCPTPLGMNMKIVEHAGWHRRIMSGASKMLIRSFATPGIYDTQRGFKLFSADAAREIFRRQTIDRFGFDIELLVIARHLGYRIRELPVEWENPAGSTVQLKDYARTFRELSHIVWNRATDKYA